MNPTRTRSRTAFFIALLGLAAATLAPEADAQLMVQLKLDKDDYVSYEAIKATVTVHNRAGQDVVLSGPAGGSWLSFDVFKRGRMISSRPGAGLGTTPFVLGAGKSITKQVDIGSMYPLIDYGNYTVNASVYFPPLRTVFPSGKKNITVSDSKPFWTQSVGVQKGRQQLASFREYSLMEHHSAKRAEIYVRLRDTRGGRVYCTYSLGRFINVTKPQATVDSQNRLHVMHMVGPRIYQHSMITSDGDFGGAELFKEEGRDRPTLMIDPGGVVQVRGGKPYNPTVAASPPGGVVRRASERPPGLPR